MIVKNKRTPKLAVTYQNNLENFTQKNLLKNHKD